MIEAAWFLLGAALASTGMYLLCSSHYDRLLEDKDAELSAAWAEIELRRGVFVWKNPPGITATYGGAPPDIDIPLGPRSA